MRSRILRLALYGLVLPLVLGFAIASAVGPDATAPDAVTLAIPTSLTDGTPDPTGATAGVVGLALSHSAIGFGSLSPGEESAPVTFKIENTGRAPVSVYARATDLLDPLTGSKITADRIHVSMSPSRFGPSITDARAFSDLTLAPGESATLYLRIEAPSGATQWLPAGAYAGTFSLTAEEVSL